MTIRKAEKKDLSYIYNIYEEARDFMRTHGNPDQWGSTYPPHSLTEEDQAKSRLYVITDTAPDETSKEEAANNKKSINGHKEEILAVFVFALDVEEAYGNIEGSWTYDMPYGVIHRVASSGRMKNITRTIFNYALTKTDYIRIDTHENNTTMQNALTRYGFRRCGTIYYTRNNSSTKRIAFDYKS